MSSKKKTPLPVCYTGNGCGGQTYMDEVIVSNTDINSMPGSFQVVSLLQHGAENAISAQDLSTLCGFKDTRTLRYKVKEARRHGALILSLPSLPDAGEKGEREVKMYIACMSRRARSEFGSISAARKYLRETESERCGKA